MAEDTTALNSTAQLKARLKAYEHVEMRQTRSRTVSSSQTPPNSSPSPGPQRRIKPSNTSPSPYSTTPRKRKSSSGYASPAKYAHLPLLPDALQENLICMFVGLNPGITTATSGHAYAHSSNRFWKLLYSSGCTDRQLRPQEDRTLPERYSMGFTNIVARPTKDQSELSDAEMVAGTAALDEKCQRFKPEAVVIVGKGIWEAIWKYRHGRTLSPVEFRYGWQDEGENMGRVGWTSSSDGQWKGSRVFVATTTSGLAASIQAAEREAIWNELGRWVQQRRAERVSRPADGKEE